MKQKRKRERDINMESTDNLVADPFSIYRQFMRNFQFLSIPKTSHHQKSTNFGSKLSIAIAKQDLLYDAVKSISVYCPQHLRSTIPKLDFYAI
jgi:hypothetical protein